MASHLLKLASGNQFEIFLLGLAIIGILIILACIILFFTRIDFKEKVQEIKLLGAEMKISVVTFFVFVGMILILPVLYTYYVAAIGEMSGLKDENKKLALRIEDLSKGQYRNVVLYLDLEGVNAEQFPKKEDLHVGYTIPGNQSNQLQTLKHWVEYHQGRRRVRVQLDEVRMDTEMSSLEVTNKVTNEVWIIEGLKPISPLITLKKNYVAQSEK